MRTIEEKIKTRDELGGICLKLRDSGQRVGFTSGAFDVLHAGHADYLAKARAMCDVLAVGVNTDRSVRDYKGPGRPIIPETQRIKLVAALESVDYAFLFDERRNKKNIEILQPAFYIKAGDYSQESMTSAATLKQYGGKIILIPVVESVSTSGILARLGSECRSAERIVEHDNAVHIERDPQKQSPAVFLDRDGTIIEEADYLHEPERIKILPNALDGIKRFQDMGYRIVIITNQPGIGIGYYSKEDFYQVNRALFKHFSQAGILIDKVYFCPHGKSEKCSCRKPELALVQRAKEELNLDLSRSIFIGDKTSDIETGKRAGMRTILVQTGFAGEDHEFPVQPDWTARDLAEAASFVLESERG
jgi:D-glycero-D-manno-heptose 1,7-bisphosphate phosphatase